jgi:cytoskeletal protein RodZ
MQTVPIESAVTMPPTPVPPESPPVPTAAEVSEVEYVSFGLYLSRAREAKGLSLDDLAHLTKIRRAILEALEHNARRDLPEKVFVLGYVRSYATAVGLNVEEAAQRFMSAWNDDAVDAAREQADSHARSYAWIWPTLATMAAAGAVWFIIRLQ